jgi:thymidine kinase
MHFPRSLLAAALASATTARNSVSAFTPRVALRPRTRMTSSKTASSLAANVIKLSDPEKELLDQVDVFIFDCDGVIWRVRPKSL